MELQNLRRQERPKVVTEVAEAAAQGDRSENAEYIYGKKRLREIDRRCRWLQKRLEVLTTVDVTAPRPGEQRCFFGAQVDVEDEEGNVATYVVLGEDETDAKRGHISYRSPLGSALLGRSVGEVVRVQTPAGMREVCLQTVTYAVQL